MSVQPQGRFQADNGSALVPAALAGLGIAWLPDCLVDDHIASGALLSILKRFPPPPAGIYIVRPPGQFPPAKVRVLTEFLIESFGTE
jgi:DNA-binding transcriptional LysR family regulator